MKKMLRYSDELTEQFVFSLPDKSAMEKIEWEGDDEFKLDGVMYDVIEKKTENGKLIIHCINDKKETELIRQYQNIAKNDLGNTSKNTPTSLLNLISSLYVIPAINPELLVITIPRNNFDSYSQTTSSHSFDVIKPPPRFL